MFYLLSAIIPALLVHTPVNCDRHESRLIKDLLRNYSVLERPVSNHSDAIVVNLGFVLQQIVSVDEKNQVMVVSSWLNFSWKDYQLKWNPLDYGGITDVRLRANMLWIPDVLVLNSIDSPFDSTYHTDVTVYSDGSTLYIPPGILKTKCAINVRWFPFDDQHCFIKFASWAYHGFQMDLQPLDIKLGVDTSMYMDSAQWLLLDCPVTRAVVNYSCCVEPYIEVFFHINIRRRTLYYWLNLILPSLLISLMPILGFILPPDSGEKITLEITTLLSVCIFLSYMAAMIPQNSDTVPLLGIYFTVCMVMVGISVLAAVVALNLHHRTPDTHKMSDTLRLLLLEWLPWLLFMDVPTHSHPDYREDSVKVKGSSITAKASGNLAFGTKAVVGNAKNLDSLAQSHDVDESTKILRKIHTELRFVVMRMKYEDKDVDEISDWKFAAMVIDRFCLIAYSISMIVVTFGIFYSAPNLFKA